MAISLSLTFNKATGKFNLTDTTDWSSGFASIDNSVDVKWLFSLDQAGVNFYKNSGFDGDNFSAPDATADISVLSAPVTTQTAIISIPTDSDGNLIQGQYTLNAKAQWTNLSASTNDEVLTEVVVTFLYVSPKAVITYDVDCLAPSLVAKDETSYDVNSVSPTTSTRTFTLTFPAPANEVDVVVSSDTITRGAAQFFTGVQQLSLSTAVTYDFSGYSVSDVIVGEEFVNVTCDAGLGDVYSCIADLREEMNSAEYRNISQYNILLQRYTKVCSLAEQYEIATRSNKPSDLNSIILQLKTILSCLTGSNEGAPVYSVSQVGQIGVNEVSDGVTTVSDVNKMMFDAGVGMSVQVTEDSAGVSRTTYTADVTQSELDAVEVKADQGIADAATALSNATNAQNLATAANEAIKSRLGQISSAEFQNINSAPVNILSASVGTEFIDSIEFFLYRKPGSGGAMSVSGDLELKIGTVVIGVFTLSPGGLLANEGVKFRLSTQLVQSMGVDLTLAGTVNFTDWAGEWGWKLVYTLIDNV